MVASALFIMDLKGKIIISRNFRGDIPMTVSDRCARRPRIWCWGASALLWLALCI